VTDTVAGWLDVDHATLSQLALAAPGDADRPVFVAYLDGERKPNLPGATGLFGGLTTGTTREQLALAAFEGVALGLIAGRDSLADAGLRETGRVLVTGGGARSPAYPQVLADLSGHPVRRTDVAESTARGACVQATAVLTGVSVPQVRDAWAPTATVAAEPRPGRAVAELRDRYAELARYRGANR
jgi:xylulokinase